MASSWIPRLPVTQPQTQALPLSPPDGFKLRHTTELSGIIWPTWWLLVGLLASTFYLFGARLVPIPVSLNLPEPLYPPAAIVLAVLLLTPPRTWWVFLLAAYAFQVAVFLWMGYSPAATLTGHLANMVEALVGAILVRRFIQAPPRFDTLWQFTLYACLCHHCRSDRRHAGSGIAPPDWSPVLAYLARLVPRRRPCDPAARADHLALHQRARVEPKRRLPPSSA